MRIINKIRRYFNPTFSEWLEDMQNGVEKEVQDPKLIKLLNAQNTQEVQSREESCFLCELDAFAKRWKPILTQITYGNLSDKDLCRKHLEGLFKYYTK